MLQKPKRLPTPAVNISLYWFCSLFVWHIIIQRDHSMCFIEKRNHKKPVLSTVSESLGKEKYFSTKQHPTVLLSALIWSPGLSLMPSSALVELLHRVEAAILEYSEELVSNLARREELEFEKEVKNTFITALMEVQNRQKEQRDSSKRRRRDKALSLQGGGTQAVNVGNAGNTGNTGSMGRTEKTGSMPVKVRGREGRPGLLYTLKLLTFNEYMYVRHNVGPFTQTFLNLVLSSVSLYQIIIVQISIFLIRFADEYERPCLIQCKSEKGETTVCISSAPPPPPTVSIMDLRSISC